MAGDGQLLLALVRLDRVLGVITARELLLVAAAAVAGALVEVLANGGSHQW